MLTYRDEETGVAQLVSGGGGAAICNLKSCVLIGIFDKSKQSSKGTLQNVHSTVDQVSAMATYLGEQGY